MTRDLDYDWVAPSRRAVSASGFAPTAAVQIMVNRPGVVAHYPLSA
jgi:hypothetical protein